MRDIEWVKILNVERFKESLLGKYYLYIIQVKPNDGDPQIIYRRYSQFYDLHIEICEIFPKKLFPDMKLPTFPAKTIFKPSEKVVIDRIKTLNEYLNQVLSDARLCSSSIINEFMTQSNSESSDRKKGKLLLAKKIEIGTPTNFVHENINESQPIKATTIKEKFVFPTADTKNDIFPAADESDDSGVDFRSRTQSEVEVEETYRLCEDWVPGTATELPATKAQTPVAVIEKTVSGWWLVTADNGKTQGWVAASFLITSEESNTTQIEFVDINSEPYTVIETYISQLEDELTVVVGENVVCTRKYIDGWWKVKRGKQEGLVPSQNLAEKTEVVLPEKPPRKREKVKRGQSLAKRKKNHREAPKPPKMSTIEVTPSAPDEEEITYRELNRQLSQSSISSFKKNHQSSYHSNL